MDSLNDELILAEQRLDKLQSGKERINALATTAKDIWALSEYRPEVICKLVEKVRVYEKKRIEIDLLCNDDFVKEILESVSEMAG